MAGSVQYGEDNTGATTRTLIANDSEDEVYGSRPDGVALVALANNSQAGLIGQSFGGSGVVGWAGQGEPTTHQSQHAGVWGYAEGNYYGVIGKSEHGIGVYGEATTAGYFKGTDEALVTRGELNVSSASTSRILKGRARISVAYEGLNYWSIVLATLQDHRHGVWVEGVELHRPLGIFTIWLNQPVAEDTDVAWFVLRGEWGYV